MSPRSSKKLVLGWREWVSIPEFGVQHIKVKVDTGARTSALHASSLKIVKRADGHRYAKFIIHPEQDSTRGAKSVTAPVLEKRRVRSSTGTETLRPVVLLDVKIGQLSFPIEVTLVNRDVMGFRMLLGRQAIRGKFMVDPGRSFIQGKKKPKRKKK